jgi:hypothetical protein
MKKQKQIKHKNLFELISEIEDHRRKQGRRYTLQTILLIIILGIMSGSKSERAISRFAKNNREDLINNLKIARDNVPGRHSITNVIQSLDFNKLEDIFHKWSMSFVKIKKGEWLSVDGKAIRGTFKYPNDKLQDFVSLVTIFSSKSKQIVKVGRINSKKENEIPKVRELIETLDLQGVTFTMDALHCQPKTLKTILNTNNNYIVGLKKNHKFLLQQVKKTVTKSTVLV